MWSLTTSESLYYRDIVVLNFLMQHLSSLLPILKPNLINLMVEWLDFFNRRKPGAVIIKENMIYGVYDSTLNQCIYDVLRLQTELFSSSDISQLLNSYTAMHNPLLSSLYITRIVKFINKQHRDGLSWKWR